MGATRHMGGVNDDRGSVWVMFQLGVNLWLTFRRLLELDKPHGKAHPLLEFLFEHYCGMFEGVEVVVLHTAIAWGDIGL